MIQLEFQIYEKTESEKLNDKLNGLALSQDTLRKGLFQRHTNTAKKLDSLQSKVQDLEHQILMLEGYIKKYVS